MASYPTYDVFLCHAEQDKLLVTHLARRLKNEGLKPFLDKWHLVPGEPWQEALEEALDQSQTCAVFLGPRSRLEPWQNEEMRTALEARVCDKSRRVIPVLLPGASLPDKEALPPFLRRLTWVEFRGGLDDPQALHCLVCGIKGIKPEAGPTGSEPLPPQPTRPTMFGVPHRNPFFIGREALLSQLHQQLQTQGISGLAQAAIHGLGGIGKTQTAIEYAHRFGENYRFVLWVVAESEPVTRATYLSIARELGLVEAQADLETGVLAVKAWLSRETNWLLLFDNADDPALLRSYLPSTRTGGKVLLTSRAKSFAKVGIKEPFRIENLDPKDAVKFLIERTGNADTEAAAELARELGYLPLALEQAAAYIETMEASFIEYLTKYRRQGVALLERGEPSTDYPKTVATTWTLSFAAVREASPASAELLAAAAFLVPDSIPIEIFTQGGSEFGKLPQRKKRLWRAVLGRLLYRANPSDIGVALSKALVHSSSDRLAFWELLEHLERFSLVARLPDDSFKLHRLTQEVVKDSLGEEGRRTWVDRIVRALNAVYPEAKFENWNLCERLQPNAWLASELTLTYKLRSAEAGRLFNVAGSFALERGDHPGAKLFEEFSLALRDRVLGSKHPDTLQSRNDLAEILRALGDFAGARKLHEQNLKILEHVLGRKHPDTLQSRNNLALTLHALGDFPKAKEILEQTLEFLEQVLGSEHPNTLLSRNNLAESFRALGDLASARKLHEQNLEIQERVLGVEHPHILASRSNLAIGLQTLGDYAGARKLHEQTLGIRERVLGAEHPDTLKSRNNLAATLRTLGDLAGARKLFKQTLETQERVLGGEHPETLCSRSNLAATLFDLGDFASARKLHEQTLEIRERILGSGHPDTTHSTWNLLCVVHNLRDPCAEAQLIDKLRWLLDRAEDAIPSADQRKIRQYMLDFLHLS